MTAVETLVSRMDDEELARYIDTTYKYAEELRRKIGYAQGWLDAAIAERDRRAP